MSELRRRLALPAARLPRLGAPTGGVVDLILGCSWLPSSRRVSFSCCSSGRAILTTGANGFASGRAVSPSTAAWGRHRLRGLVCLRHALRFWWLADLIAPGLALGYAFARVGCFLNGCCYGRLTSLPWAVQFHDPPLSTHLTPPSHPVQLYAVVANLALFGILAYFWRRKRYDGQITGLYLILYSVHRFIAEGFRKGVTGNLFALGMTEAQWASLAIAAAGVGPDGHPAQARERGRSRPLGPPLGELRVAPLRPVGRRSTALRRHQAADQEAEVERPWLCRWMEAGRGRSRPGFACSLRSQGSRRPRPRRFGEVGEDARSSRAAAGHGRHVAASEMPGRGPD